MSGSLFTNYRRKYLAGKVLLQFLPRESLKQSSKRVTFGEGRDLATPTPGSCAPSHPTLPSLPTLPTMENRLTPIVGKVGRLGRVGSEVSVGKRTHRARGDHERNDHKTLPAVTRRIRCPSILIPERREQR